MVSDDRFENSLAGARTGVIVNIFLVIIKASAGILSGSFAILADALHTAADIVASAVVYVGIRVSSKPADAEHPYGHGKAESIASKIVSIIVILAGLNIGFFSFRALFHVSHPVPGQAALWAAVISIVVKEGLFRHTYRVGQSNDCKALVANAYEHRSDALSSVAAVIGIGGARLGLYLGQPQLYYLDPLAGIIVSIFIVNMGWKIAKTAASELMDAQTDPEFSAELERITLMVAGVWEVHSIRTRCSGPNVFVDLEIGVDESITVLQGHDIAKQVKATVLVEKPTVADILIHVNPCRDCAQKRDLEQS